jgi:hypothetical protein
MNPLESRSLTSGLYNPMGDKIDYTFYDRLKMLSSNTQPRDFFTIGVGEADPLVAGTKTLADTNFRKGQMPAGQSFVTRGMIMYYESSLVKTEANLLSVWDWIHKTYIQIFIDSKNEYGTWKLSEIMGVTIDSIMTPAVAGNNSTVPSTGVAKGLKIFNTAFKLPTLTGFRVTISSTAASAAALDSDFINCAFVGTLDRAS